MPTPAVNTDPRRAGFTIIEILVVLGIIVLIAGILIPVVLNAYGRADRTRIRFHMQGIETALEAYKTDFGSLPVTKVDNEDMPSPGTMGSWDRDINRDGLRGARVLAKALVGIGPTGDWSQANFHTGAGHVLGQDGAGSNLDGSGPTSFEVDAAPGFRVAGRGGEVNGRSKVYGPYLNVNTYRVAETVTPGVPGAAAGNLGEVVAPIYPDGYTLSGTSYTPRTPLWDGFVILDPLKRPILYYPVLNPQARIEAQISATNGYFISDHTFNDAGSGSPDAGNLTQSRQSMYRATDNSAWLRTEPFRYVMGDVNLNGRIDAGETPAVRGGYVLYSAGPDTNFLDFAGMTGTAAELATERKRRLEASDDVSTFLP